MKKNRLLTGIAALALVLSLGACETGDININVDVGGVEINPNDSSLSEDTNTEDTTTEDDDDGGNAGTENDGDDGDGGNTGDDGDGDGDGDDDGNDDDGGSTEDPSLALAQETLDVAASTQYLEWDALEATEYEDGQISAKVLLALDDNEKGYGYWYTYDDEKLDSCNYYVDGTKYVYEPNEEEGEQYSTTDYGANIDLDTFLDDYSEVLEDVGDINLSDENTSYTLDGNTLCATISKESHYATLNYQYKFTVDNDKTALTALAYYGPDNDLGLTYSGFSASESTYEDVSSAMAEEFDITNWEEPTPKWSDYMSETNYNKATNLLGTTLDGLVPVILPSEGNYTSINVSGTRVTFELYDDSGKSTPKYDYETLTYAWKSALPLAGWSTSTSTKNLEYVIWSYELDNFLAVLQSYSEISGVYNWDLHIYPSH